MNTTRVNEKRVLFLCVILIAFTGTQLMAASGSSFQPQTRVGFTVGDQWEPSIAADRYGHVYILVPQYTNDTQATIPGCSSCPSPTMFLNSAQDLIGHEGQRQHLVCAAHHFSCRFRTN